MNALYKYLLVAGIVKLPDVKLSVFKTLKTRALHRQPDFGYVFCWFLLPSEEDRTLLFVDSENNELKRVDLQSESVVDVIYRCNSPAKMVAALFVEFAPQQEALLVAERLPDAAANSMSHSLSVALRDASRWTRRQRVPLETATCELKYTYPVSIGTVHTNKVLCGVWETSALEALAVDATGTARRLQPVRLGFAHLCFATGRSQDTELLVISLASFTEVRLLQVANGESLSVRLLRVIFVRNCNRLLWRAGLLFAASWDAQTETDEVSVWHVSGDGRHVERRGTPIARADNLRIQCWSAVRERFALFDVKSEEVLVYELKN